MQKMGWLGALKVMGNATIRQSAYDFLFEFNRNYVSIFYRFRDIASYLSKVADFDPSHLHLAPPQGVTPVEFRGDLWRQKTRVHGLSCGVVYVILRLAVLVEHRLVTDRQTQAHGYSTADAQHRAVKSVPAPTDKILTHVERSVCGSRASCKQRQAQLQAENCLAYRCVLNKVLTIIMAPDSLLALAFVIAYDRFCRHFQYLHPTNKKPSCIMLGQHVTVALSVYCGQDICVNL